MAAMVFTNLLYLVGAIAGATLVSVLILFRHRKPKSLEAGIDNFSRELQALAPDHRSGQSGAERPDPRRPPRPPAGTGRPARGGPPDPMHVRRYSAGYETGPAAPDREDQPG
ncbi:MAG: hypothetical protein M3N98_10315 [Actinomycetota bacterium]|nr:hypothetical protein [Actinomycetota bacterium]